MALLQIHCQLHDHASNMTMMERVIMNGTVESCMAIYLRMVAVLRKVYGGCMMPAKVRGIREASNGGWMGKSAYNPWTQH